MPSSKSVLCIGINPSKRDTEETKNAPPSEAIRNMITKQIQDAKDAGYELQVELIAPNEMSEKIPQIRDMLVEKRWDGFIIGGGIRKELHLTDYFEQLVNAGREIRPQARMGFNTSPMDIVDTMKRMFEN